MPLDRRAPYLRPYLGLQAAPSLALNTPSHALPTTASSPLPHAVPAAPLGHLAPAPSALAPSRGVAHPRSLYTTAEGIRAAAADPSPAPAVPKPEPVTFTAAPLPYALDALEPKGMSREQLTVHYEKHHKGYAAKLTDLARQNPKLQGLTLEELLLTQPPGAAFNCAAQIWNHNFYWYCLSPDGGTPPTGQLLDQIVHQWGSLEEFQKEFNAAATGLFGSGWVWLVKTPLKKLAIVSTKDADTPVLRGLHPLLVCDVWEHAYYVDFRSDRAKHVETFWKLANWPFAEALFLDAFL